MSEHKAGYLYVLELTSDLIKVGIAGAPVIRLRTHSYDLRKKGITILRQWVSPKHAEAYPNEDSLIAACERLGGIHQNGREWFTGLRFDDVVTAASALPFTDCSGDGAMAIEEARANLSEIAAQVRLLRKAVMLTRRGNKQVAIVPAELAEAAEEVGGPDKAAELLRQARVS
jgi:hypothetical protein